MYKYC